MRRLLDLFFVPKCVFCQRVIEKGALCEACERTLPYVFGPFKGVEFASKCIAPLRYEGVVRESLVRYKFSRRQSYSKEYARLIAEAVTRDAAGEFELITWAPVSGRRRRKRGFDQSELIARELSERLGVKCKRLLRKTRDTEVQSRLEDSAARRANVMGAYRAVNTSELRGKRVLLVDDIITTGATASECARTLLMAGAEEVICASVAWAKRKKQ